MSSANRILLQPAYVLHYYPYRDTSLLVDVYTRDHGRVGLVARGARTSKRQRPLLQPFRPLLLSWLSGRGELGTLTACESNGAGMSLQAVSLFSGYYFNELLLRLLHKHDPHPALFQYYDQALKELQKGGGQRVLRLFEKRLLEELGYGLQLDCDIDNQLPLSADCAYEFRLEQGPVAVNSELDSPLCFTGRSLLSLQREELSDVESLRDAKRLMRAALGLYLGERPLRTREVLQRLSSL